MRFIFSIAIAASFALPFETAAAQSQPYVHSPATVERPANVGWPLEGNDGANTFFSPLADINDSNVKRLGLLWSVELPTLDGAIGTPIISDGVIYQSASFSRVVANDLRTGALLWDFRPTIHYLGTGARRNGITNRGVAVWKDKVYVNTGDCRLLAIDRKTGKQVWEAGVCTDNPALTITSMPHLGAGMVFVGTSNGDYGTSRCHVSAFDAETGKRKWRFYTYPGDPKEDAASADPAALRMAAKTWGKGYAPRGGCPWNSVVYDAKLDLLYVGTGGPTPIAPSQRGKHRGTELFSNSIVALQPETGRYVWHFQVTPDDGANLEAIESIVVADLPIDGVMRHVLLQAPKNGFFFVLDAKTGKLISAKNFVPVNWTEGFDPKTGHASWRSEVQYWNWPGKHAAILPTSMGAHGVQPMSFSPLTRLAYIPALDMPHDWWISADGSVESSLTLHAADAKVPLIAWDPVTQRERWRVDRPLPINSGVLSTGGNLVFQGLGTGEIEAYRADTGQRLWSYQTNTGIAAAPITVKIDGRQLLIVSGGNGASLMTLRGWRPFWNAPVRDATPHLMAFELGAHGEPPALTPVPPLPKPLVAATADPVNKGAALYSDLCEGCHGVNLEALRGSVPDLRRSPIPTNAAAFEAVVVGGARLTAGMPIFTELTEADAQEIRRYIIDRSWAAYNTQQGSH